MNGAGRPTVPTRVADAIADLARLRSDDPAARGAVQAIKLTRLTLESFGTGRHRPTADCSTDNVGSTATARRR